MPGAVGWSVPAVCAGLVGGASAGAVATCGVTHGSYSVGASSGSMAVTSPRPTAGTAGQLFVECKLSTLFPRLISGSPEGLSVDRFQM